MLVVDVNRNNKIILLCPRLEEWIIESTKKAKIHLRDFGLPDDANKLHKILNTKNKDKLNKFRDLVKYLIDKNDRRILELINIFKQYKG